MSEEQVTTPHLPSTWSLKDTIAHLWAWQQRSIARLEAAALEQEPNSQVASDLDPESEGDTDQVNAWIYATYRDCPVQGTSNLEKVPALPRIGAADF